MTRALQRREMWANAAIEIVSTGSTAQHYKFIWTKRTKHKLQAPANFQKSTPSWQLTFLKQKSARCIRIQIWNQKNNLQNLQLYDVPKIPITTSIHIEGILHHEKKMHSPARSKQSRQFIQTQITTWIGRKFLENWKKSGRFRNAITNNLHADVSWAQNCSNCFKKPTENYPPRTVRRH